MSQYEPDERSHEVRTVLLKFVGFAAAVVLFIVIVTVIAVKALDLNDSATPVSGTPDAPTSALPNTALPTDGESETPDPEVTVTPVDPSNPTQSPGSTDLFLNASPVFVKPMERINLTGQWPGKDNMSLLIQRFEDGEWVDFGVQVQVQVGTFETYVMTGREGPNKFRLLDPESGSTSNEVTVTIG